MTGVVSVAGADAEDSAASESRGAAATVRRAPGKAEVDYERWARRGRIVRGSLSVAFPLALFALWELGAAHKWFDPRFFSSPTRIWDSGVELVREGQLQSQLLITTRRLVLGYLIGVFGGVVVGLLLSQSQLLRSALEPTLRALYVIPKLAMLPVLLLIFGLNEKPKVLFVVIGVFFIMAFSTLTAASMIPTGFREVAASHRLSWWQRMRWLVLPASSPQIAAGLKLASGIAVLLVIAAEFVQSTDGIGYMSWRAWELFIADQMYVGIVVISLLGVAFSSLIGLVGRRLTRWTVSADTSI